MNAEDKLAAAIEALRLVEYGSCDGCGGKRYCAECGASAVEWSTESDDYVRELHEKTCAVGIALGRCKP